MDNGFEKVWRRVTGSAAVVDEMTYLRRLIGEEAASAQTYASMLKRAGYGQLREVLALLKRTKLQQLRQLRVLYFLRTGERPEPQSWECPAEPMMTMLRRCYQAELAAAESYRAAEGGAKPDAATLFQALAEASEGQAVLLRKLLERFV